MVKKNIAFIIILFGFIFIVSCIKEEISTDRSLKLEFSTDTVSFDTVFTTIGTSTQWFQVRNPNRQAVNVGKISLAGGKNSPFRLNIDGKEGNEDYDVVIQGKDSIFIFVEATIDPTNTNNPMVVKDSIVFQTNGNIQDVKLIAFGQDFHLINGEVIKSRRWKNDKPYLVYNSMLVDSLETLTIDPGCRIYFHKKSSLFVYGTLIVNGTSEEPVIFQGDRLEEFYSNIPGQWGDYRENKNTGQIEAIFGGIHLLQGSNNNKINGAIIKNGNKGIQADSILGKGLTPELILSNTRIENMSALCLDARTSHITATNCVFGNSSSFTVALLLGGLYEFNHCTIANNNGEARKNATVLMKNYYDYGNTRYVYDQAKVDFKNCIIYGSKSEEIEMDIAPQGLFNYRFMNCFLKTSGKETDPLYAGSIFNKDPKFTIVDKYNFYLDSLSTARNVANIEIARLFPTDLYNNSRLNDLGPDIGAIEWIPKKKK